MAAVNVPLLAIVGETASGKTELAIALAELCNGEIICADSRTIYRGLDIGTAKPTPAERAAAPHHLLDIRDPDETYTVAEFQKDALARIADIASRGRLPILVGGSGLYIDAVIFGYTFQNDGVRDETNPRHLAVGSGSQDKRLRPNTLVLGMQRPREDLEARITARVEAMVAAGLVEEVRTAVSTYGREAPGLSGICYGAFADYLDGTISLDEAKAMFVRGDKVLAKKQRTWFRRNKSIQWVDNRRDAVAITTTWMNNLPK